MGRQRVYLAVQGKGRQVKRKVKVTRKGGGEEHCLVKSEHRTPSCGLKKIEFGGPKRKRCKKSYSKRNESVWKCGCRTYQPVKGSSNDFKPNRGRIKDQKKELKVLILTQDVQPLKHQVKKDKTTPGNETIGIPT